MRAGPRLDHAPSLALVKIYKGAVFLASRFMLHFPCLASCPSVGGPVDSVSFALCAKVDIQIFLCTLTRLCLTAGNVGKAAELGTV